MQIQVRPGAEALVETLTPGCELLLYTAREASQVAQVLDRCPALRAAFLPHAAPDAPPSAAAVRESPACFTLADWLEVMDALLDRALDDAPALDDLDRRLLGLVRDYARDPASLLHLKLPELAARRGKRGFDVIVDDSPGLGDLLDRVGSDVGRVHLPQELRQSLGRSPGAGHRVQVGHVPGAARVEDLRSVADLGVLGQPEEVPLGALQDRVGARVHGAQYARWTGLSRTR